MVYFNRNGGMACYSVIPILLYMEFWNKSEEIHDLIYAAYRSAHEFVP